MFGWSNRYREEQLQRIANARMAKEVEFAAAIRAGVLQSLPAVTPADLEASVAASIHDLRQRYPDGFYPHDVRLNVTVVKQPIAPAIGMAFGPGAMPDYSLSPLALRIAHAGLEHWLAGSGKLAQTFLDGSLAVTNNRLAEKEFIRSAPGGVTDERWVRVMHTTCTMAAYTSGCSDCASEALPFRQIDSLACRCKHGALDRFTALAEDSVWGHLQPPFSWLCACTVLPLTRFDVPRPSYASTPGLPRLSPMRLRKAQEWATKPPSVAFPLL